MLISFHILNTLQGLLFGGLAVYFTVGALYLYKSKGATGSDLVINKEFWFSIPGYIRVS